MPVRNALCCAFCLFAICLAVEFGAAQNRLPVSSLCNLQVQLTRGEHRRVRVEGVYLAGLEAAYLVDAGCSGRSTRVEFALKTHRNWDRLQAMIRRPYKESDIHGDGEPVLVFFDGEFYGPPLPDPKLPEAIRNIYHPGWDSNATTKLVVDGIESIKDVPADNPCAPPKSDPTQCPCFQRDSVPHRAGTTNP
jgi:hypothetical protein